MKTDISDIKSEIIENYMRNGFPPKDVFLSQLSEVNSILEDEDETIRPLDANLNSGGIINLKKDIPTIIVPDLHGRGDFLLNILFIKDKRGISVIDNLKNNEMQLVCIGDGMHAESRALDRWKKAFIEYKSDYKTINHIGREMIESLFVMQTVVMLKIYFPENFHYLKGNHDNITNEDGNGNYPFAKFCYEGAMVTHFIKKFIGTDFIQEYSRFEKNLPLFCIGENFLISHAQPERAYSPKELINYRNNPEVIYGLTWTDNGVSQPGSVKSMLDYYLKNSGFEKKYFFGGHRPVQGLYKIFDDENYVQIHNPNKFIIAYLKSNSEIDLDRDIVELKNNIKFIVN